MRVLVVRREMKMVELAHKEKKREREEDEKQEDSRRGEISGGEGTSGKTGGRVEGIIRKEIRFCVSSARGEL